MSYRFTRVMSAAATLFFAAAAHAAVSVQVTFVPAVISFAPGEAIYILGMRLEATGFTDDSNTNNYIRLSSGNGSFQGDLFPARGTGTGTLGSVATPSAAALSAAMNSQSTWTMTLTDGITNLTSTYTLNVTTPGISADFMRPITLDTPPDTDISEFPSFSFTQDDAVDPAAENTSAYAFMIGSGNNFVTLPPLGVNDTSWTPDGPLVGDSYTLVVSKSVGNAPSSLIDATTPSPNGGAPALAAFTSGVSIQSDAQSNNLRVPIPQAYVVNIVFTPGAISFSTTEPPIYILGVGVSATGFVDESNEDNFIRVESETNAFSGDYYPARGTGSGTAGSNGYDSAALLSDAINDTSGWTMTIVDGTTGITRTYPFTVTTPGIAADYLRPITLDVAPGSVISDSPTFQFSQPSTAIPDAQTTDSYGAFFGHGGYVGNPPLANEATSWTPAGAPFAPDDDYLVLIVKINYTPPQSLIEATTPPGLLSLTYDVSCQVSAQSGNLVIGTPCSADFDGDGDTGTDADIESFFACLAGSCCPTCQTADFDADGDTGTDADIEAFFRVLAGGNC